MIMENNLKTNQGEKMEVINKVWVSIIGATISRVLSLGSYLSRPAVASRLERSMSAD